MAKTFFLPSRNSVYPEWPFRAISSRLLVLYGGRGSAGQPEVSLWKELMLE
jgi:hypothetical protein